MTHRGLTKLSSTAIAFQFRIIQTRVIFMGPALFHSEPLSLSWRSATARIQPSSFAWDGFVAKFFDICRCKWVNRSYIRDPYTLTDLSWPVTFGFRTIRKVMMASRIPLESQRYLVAGAVQFSASFHKGAKRTVNLFCLNCLFTMAQEAPLSGKCLSLFPLVLNRFSSSALFVVALHPSYVRASREVRNAGAPVFAIPFIKIIHIFYNSSLLFVKRFTRSHACAPGTKNQSRFRPLLCPGISLSQEVPLLQ